jgi:CelD/BcsL family acetyltransferase involved in cellulose biosynthesis
LNVLFKLHELRAQRKNIVSTFQGTELLQYHNSLVNRINQQSTVWLRFLKNEETTAAALYAFAFEGRVFYYQIGIDPAWERFGPGMVIIYEALQEAFAHGYHEYNFLRGGEEYKTTWTQHHRDLFLCNVYNNSTMGTLARTSSRSIHSVKSRVKALYGGATRQGRPPFTKG